MTSAYFWLTFFIILLVVTVGGILIYLMFVLLGIFGAPFIRTPYKIVTKILELADPEEEDVVYDLGSGDGRIVIEAVKKYNVKAIGVEINPVLVYYSRRKIKKLGLQNKAKIVWGNLFRINLSRADIIIMYLLQPTNNLLEKKLLKEVSSKAKIISKSFTFKKIPLFKTHSEDSHLKLYKIPPKLKNEKTN